jgi:2-oxoglutarate ferredoxin oxidoreductase subunit gamma
MIPFEVNENRTEIRLAGEGGQGMILAGIILAEAAAIYDGLQVVQSQSYGPEARGGASKSEVILSHSAIDFPKVIQADVVIALSQEANDKYGNGLKENGILIVDAVQVTQRVPANAIRLPITRIARDTTGREITTNTVALGILVGLTGIVSPDAIRKAVSVRAPRGTGEMNLAALEAGFQAARAYTLGETTSG